MSGKEQVPSQQFFLSQSNGYGYCTRGHSTKLQVQRSRLNVRRHFFFSQRVVQNWNRLPQNVVEATTVIIQATTRQVQQMWALKAMPTELIDIKVKVSQIIEKEKICQLLLEADKVPVNSSVRKFVKKFQD